MSTADDPGRPPRSDRPSIDPKRTRLLIAAVVLGAVVLVIAFMVLVSQCGAENDSEIVGAMHVSSGSSAGR
jgi:hypothetical protein